MIHMTRHEFEEVLDRKLRPIERALGLLNREVNQMDATGEALKAAVEQLSGEVQSENEEIVNVATAVTSAGSKFEELKALVEKQTSGALSDEEAEQLSTLLGEVGGHISTATTELTSHVQTLEQDTSAA
jgi:methyl-accepting chemotaxis protein